MKRRSPSPKIVMRKRMRKAVEDAEANVRKIKRRSPADRSIPKIAKF